MVKKPARLTTSEGIYAQLGNIDFDGLHADGWIGGDNLYNGTQQIHLSKTEIHALAKWLTKASEYLKQKEKK